MSRPRIGVALGGGSARGWAHIGVLEALADLGVVPDVVCGTSMGALVGAAHAMGRLPALHTWADALHWRGMARLLDVRIARGGLIDGARIETLLAEHGIGGDIEECAVPFAAVATDIESGGEVWLRTGAIARAVRASIGLPGIFTPVQVGTQWLLDGGLVNPVPVSAARSLGADIVIAVDVNSSRLWRSEPREPRTMLERLRGWRANRPSYFEAMARAVTIMQVQITLARFASEPADIVLVPNLSGVGPFQFERAGAVIAEGRACVERSAQALRALA